MNDPAQRPVMKTHLDARVCVRACVLACGQRSDPIIGDFHISERRTKQTAPTTCGESLEATAQMLVV